MFVTAKAYFNATPRGATTISLIRGDRERNNGRRARDGREVEKWGLLAPDGCGGGDRATVDGGEMPNPGAEELPAAGGVCRTDDGDLFNPATN